MLHTVLCFEVLYAESLILISNKYFIDFHRTLTAQQSFGSSFQLYPESNVSTC